MKWLATLAALFCTAATGADIAGTVQVAEQGRQLRVVEDVAVYYRPEQPREPPVPAQPYEMSARNKEFEPRVLPIPQGATVRFPNLDPILHNVFSLSPGNEFDAGLYGPGDGESYRFDTVGLVRVYCNVHQAMVGHVLVLDTPHFVMAASDGSFQFDGVEPGSGTLYVWHERARPLAVPITVPLAEALTLELSLTRRKVPEHANKFGKPYRRTRDRGRY